MQKGREYWWKEVVRPPCGPWVDGDKISFLVAGFSTDGGDLFFASHYRDERKPLKQGDAFLGRAGILLIKKK